MIETKVPQAKALDELFSRGETEVNWMGLDVDDASDKKSEGEELLNYEQGKAIGSEVQSDMWTDEMVFNVTLAIWMRAIWEPLRMRSNLICGWIFWKTHVKLQPFYLYNHFKQVILNLYIGSSLQGGVHSRYIVYRWLHSLHTTIYKCNSSEVNSLNLKPYTLKAYSFLWLKDLSDND